MADDVATADPKPAEKPLDQIADTERALDAGPAVGGDPAADRAPATSQVTDPPREVPAADRIRAFEDEHVGPEAVRIGGRIERGYGSPFAELAPELKRQYAALEKLVAAEQNLADAHTKLIQAEADHEAALAAAEPKPDASE